MAIHLELLGQGIHATEGTLYTATEKTLLRQVLIADTGGAGGTASISIVPEAGTAGNANRIARNIPVAADDVTVMDLWQIIDVGSTLSVKGSSTAITITASGIVGVA